MCIPQMKLQIFNTSVIFVVEKQEKKDDVTHFKNQNTALQVTMFFTT